MDRRAFLYSLAGASLLPASVKRAQIGANTAITGMSLADSLALLHKIGFPIVEIHPMGKPEATPGKFPGFPFNELSTKQRLSIKEELKPFRHVTTHLPYTGLDYFAKDEAVAEAAVKAVDIALEGSAYFGAEVAVLHPKTGAGQTDESQWPVMLRRIRRWGDIAQRHKIRIALETGYPASIANFVRLVKEVDHPAVGATIDVGHQSKYAELVARIPAEKRGTPEGIRAYNDTTLAIIEGLGSKTFHLHVHDIDPQTWKEHLPLGTNFVDYTRLFAQLNHIDYKGFLIFEIGGKPEEMEHHLRDGKARLEKMLAG